MSAIALLMAGLAAFQVEVTLAPDQPIPHIYVGDPVILELHSDRDLRLDLTIHVENDIGDPVELDLGTVELRAHSAYWHPIEGLPDERGRYQATIRLSDGIDIQEDTLVYARVDRPVDGLTLPVGINVHEANRSALHALPIVSIRRIRTHTGTPDIEDQLETAAAAGLSVILVLDSADPDEAVGHMESLIGAYGDHIVRIDLASDLNLQQIQSVADTLQRINASLPLALMVDTPERLAALLRRGAGRFFSLVVVNGHDATMETAAAFRRIAEQAGYEGMPIHVSAHNGDADPNDLSFIKTLVRNAAAQVHQTNLNVNTVFDNGAFGPGYAPLGGFARRLHGADYAGDLPVGAGQQAHVFRIDRGWCIVAWAAADDDPMRLDLNGARGLRLSDSYNNQLALPPSDEDGALTVAATRRPIYLSGTGGSIIATAAVRMARKEAQTMLAIESLQEDMPADLLDLLEHIASNGGGTLDRQDFFSLVRHFPFLEREWHNGGMQRSSAVMAMASLARLVRHLGVIEQSSGEPFIEPFQETLDRCSQYQSSYLTRSGGSNGAQERGDWLLKEVGRLMTEAEALMANGRAIEANALATMAEWRARSLEFAATAAPLSQPDADDTDLDEDGTEPKADTPQPDPAVEADEDSAVEDAPDADSDDLEEAHTEDMAEADEDETGEPEQQVFQVEPGEGPWAIAQKHGVDLDDLRRWNNWGQNPTLRIGQEYIIQK